ncbi:hypothetical protein QFZ79_000452 [Arthrobacter sp. V4I6]|uniref:hypothetical protein n=1 Tax=unclassified Arthrobacter TaxID=235627 RepID=UPI00277FF7A8|nr:MULTISPECIES: hypothetical protein [unclassified Arthrobacter]MDQ0822713.1 hypothetical protein [Arthrobacter sp. V1I7]MDQ0852341.1 hypothetical protein [Arthrobacter sp. V4I6]
MTDRTAEDSGPEREDDQFAVRLKGTPEQVDQLLRRGEFDVGDHPHISDNRDGTGWLDLFLTSRQIGSLRAEGYEIQVGANLSEQARVRLAEVGAGDRFDGGRAAPQGLGRKVHGDTGGGKPGGPADGPAGKARQ